MAEEFISDLFDLNDFNDNASSPSDREPVKVLLLGSRRGIAHMIHRFHQHHLIEAGDWSRPQAVPNSDKDEMMSITVKYIRLD